MIPRTTLDKGIDQLYNRLRQTIVQEKYVADILSDDNMIESFISIP